LELKEAQDLIRRIYYERDHARGLFTTFTWFVEEVGELARAILEMDKPNMREEIADVFAWLLSVANLLNIDLEEAFKAKYARANGSL
jgi:NTP pyrophosphatase (non-canonical NTP hydrolase)